MYADTDSAIYVDRGDGVKLALGDNLGDFTNELGKDQYITEFVSGGCKQYAYKVNTGEEVCKIRGFTLNYKNSNIINFESMKKLIVESREQDQNLSNHTLNTENARKITRDKATFTIYNRPETKIYRPVNNKRMIDWQTMDTLPFGY